MIPITLFASIANSTIAYRYKGAKNYGGGEMDDPMSKYEQCPKCGNYTDDRCCQHIDHKWFNDVIERLDSQLTHSKLTDEQRKYLTDAANAFSKFRSITQKDYTF